MRTISKYSTIIVLCSSLLFISQQQQSVHCAHAAKIEPYYRIESRRRRGLRGSVKRGIVKRNTQETERTTENHVDRKLWNVDNTTPDTEPDDPGAPVRNFELSISDEFSTDRGLEAKNEEEGGQFRILEAKNEEEGGQLKATEATPHL